MAHMINGRDSNPKTLGVKKYAGQAVRTGTIIAKQRGTRFKAGRNVRVAKDDTLFAMADGIVHYDKRKIVSVIAPQAPDSRKSGK